MGKAKVSPIFYMGNKKRLINKGLVELFPKNINVFVDLFAGSGVVSLNVDAKYHLLNELDRHVYGMYKNLKNITPEDIIGHIESRVEEYGLPLKSTHSKNTSKEEREFYKEKYMKFRDNYNNERNELDLFVLMNYCMSQAIRFNDKGEFNMPFGSDRFIKGKHSERFVDFHKFLNQDSVKITNKTFTDFSTDIYNKNDFIYLDPPYINTIATYNENGKWATKEQEQLLLYCEKLNNRGIKFAMSNVFVNRDYVNEDLMKWCEDNGLKVHVFSKFSYSNFGKETSCAKEVLIMNY